MSEWSPPAIPRILVVIIGVLYIALFGYGLFIAGQVILFGILPGMLLISIYFLWRFLTAVEAIADALQRIARQREQN